MGSRGAGYAASRLWPPRPPLSSARPSPSAPWGRRRLWPLLTRTPPSTFAWGPASSRGEGAARTPNPRQQHETPTDNLLHPPPQKKFAQKQRRRRKRARRGPGPPSRRAPLPTGGGHPARAAGCGAHAGASASLQHHDGYGRDFSHGARAPCFQSAKGYTFWAPLLWTLLLRSAAAPCVLDKPVPTACACHVPFFYFHRVHAAASLAPRPPPPMPALLFHRKRHAWLRTDS